MSLLSQTCYWVHIFMFVKNNVLSLVFVPAPGQVDVVVQEFPESLLCHLLVKVLQQVVNPLKGVCVRTHPVEVNLPQLHVRLGLLVFMPDVSEDGSKRSDPDSSSHEYINFIPEYVLCSCSKWPINRQSWHFSGRLEFSVIDVACLGQSFRPITSSSNPRLSLSRTAHSLGLARLHKIRCKYTRTCKSQLSWLDINPNTANVTRCILGLHKLYNGDSNFGMLVHVACTPRTFCTLEEKCIKYQITTSVYLMNPCNIWGQFCPTHIWRDKAIFRWSDCETLAHTEPPFGVWRHCKGIFGLYGTPEYLLHIELAV